MSKILSRNEAAKFLKVSLPTLHKLVKQNQLPAYRLGRKIVFKDDELINSLKSVNYGNK